MANRTTLAPDIVAAILDDAMPNHVTLFDLALDPLALWDAQRARPLKMRMCWRRPKTEPLLRVVPTQN